MEAHTALQNLRLEVNDVLQNGLFADLLFFYMQREQMSGKTLARLINVAESTISNWRNGERLPKTDMVFLISKALNLTPLEKISLLTAHNATQKVLGLKIYLKTAIQYNQGDEEAEVIKSVLESLEKFPEVE